MGDKVSYVTNINSRSGQWFVNLKEIWRYRDLLVLFVKRDFISFYKQTVLGPLWFVIQPVLMTLVFSVIFGGMMGVPTDGIPAPLFYLAGLTAFTYFQDCLTKTATTFTTNASIFGKVYFPRLIIPLSVVISNLLKFTVQFVLFAGFIIYYDLQGAEVNVNAWALLFPLLLLTMAFLGLGFGLLITALSTKYRDFQFLVGFGVRLLMYLSPVIYPISWFKKNPTFHKFLELNPLTGVIEWFKYGFLGGNSQPEFWYLIYSVVFSVVILIVGILIFSRVERNFVDTV